MLRRSKMSKTLGQIAYEKRQQYYREAHFDNWAATEWDFLAAHMKRAEQTAANAIVEECVKALCWDCAHGDAPKFAGDAGMYLHEFEEQIPRGCAASELYSLKAANSAAGLKSPQGDTATAEERIASLTPKSETPDDQK
jgi:hypothetical protein